MSEKHKISGSLADADLETLKSVLPTEFDGHTEFYRMSPWQRLAWMNQAVAFIAAAKDANNKVGALPPGQSFK